MGKLLNTLGESGRADDTTVILTSEQGSAFPGNKWTNWNTGVHTAFVVRWPRNVVAGERTDALIQYADVLPTVVATAGAGQGNRFDGKSFLPVLLGQASQRRDCIYLMHIT